MKLKKFIEENIEHNTMVRLLTNVAGGHHCVEDNWDKVYMNHEIENTQYKDWEAICVTSVLGTGRHSEAINIVVVDPNPYRNFINNLRADEDMQRAYIDNIAMAFQDCYDQSISLSENANNSAEYFLKQLIEFKPKQNNIKTKKEQSSTTNGCDNNTTKE